MPKPIATPERTARTVRSHPDVVDQMDTIAFKRRSAFNEVANAFFEDGLRLAELDDDVRQILIEAGETATRIMRGRQGTPLTGNARLLNAERLLRVCITEAATRHLIPNRPMLAMELWAGAIEIVEELALTGEPWDLITSIRSTSPPLTQDEMKRIETGINRRAKNAATHEKERLETLAAYAAHAQHQHLEDWDDLKKQARVDLDAALGVTKHGTSE